MSAEPIRALDKRLRDGRRITIDLVPRDADSGYWMVAEIDGQPASTASNGGMTRHGEFTAVIERDASPVPGMPHVIGVHIDELCPDGYKRPVRRPIGLADAEADGIEAAEREWRQRIDRRVRAAVPDAPTWTEEHHAFPARPSIGWIITTTRGPAVVLDVTDRTWIDDDGWSFNLDAEQGWLYTVTVRAATPAEIAAGSARTS